MLASRNSALLMLVLVTALALSAASAQDTPAHGPLRLLGNANLAPIVFAEAGQARGVAVDLAKAAAKEAGLEVDVEAMNWREAQDAVREGRADGLIHINPTPERLRTLAFSAPLLETRLHIYRLRGRREIQDMASLKGLRVGVERSGMAAQYLANLPAVRATFVTSWTEAFEHVGQGSLDAVLVDQWAGDYALARLARSDIVAVEPAVQEDYSRIAVPKERAELLEALDQGLQAIERNGTREAILRRWSGQEVLYLTRQSVERNIIVAGVVLAACGALLALGYAMRLKRLNRDLARARREAEQTAVQLRGLMAEQSAIVEGDAVGIVKVRNRVILWANPALATMFGYTVEELVGQSTRRMFETDEDFVRFGALLSQTLQAQGRFRGDLRQVRKDGTAGWFDFSITVLDRGNGTLMGAVVEVTAEREAKAALQKAYAETSALYNESPIGLHSLGPDGTVLRINDVELGWLGLQREQVVGRMNYADLLTPDSRAVFERTFPRFKQIGVMLDVRADLRAADGSTRPVLATARAVYDAAGQFVMSRSTVLDLSQQLRAQAQMEQAQHIGHIGSWEVDLATGQMDWSREMRHLFGLAEDAPLSIETTRNALHPEDRDWALARYQRACTTGEPLQLRCRLVGPGGEIRHIDTFAECRRDAQGGVTAMVGMTRDVTAEVRSAQELARSEQRFAAVVETQSELICRMKADSTVLLANSRFCKTFGLEASAIVGESWQPFVHPDDLAMVQARLGELSALKPTVVIENRVLTASEGVRWMEFINQGFFDEQGTLVEVQAVGRDITERKKVEELLAASNVRLSSLATRDPLTGLFNRRQMDEVLAVQLAEAQASGHPLSVLMLDLDHFKQINDQHGHAAGDGILAAVGKLLAANTREGDVACRYGGEEFLLVLPGTQGAIGQHRAEQIRAGVQALEIPVGSASLHVTISVGVATSPRDGETVEQLLKSADGALYAAKLAGRNCVRVSG